MNGIENKHFFALYYKMIHRQGKSLNAVKLQILKDRQQNKLSDFIYFDLMKGLAKAEREDKQLDEITKFLDT